MSQERLANCINGWIAVAVHLLLCGATAFWFSVPSHQQLTSFVACLLVLLALCRGYFMVYPNTAKVMTLLGSYAGTVRHNGFLWANPLYRMRFMSLRLQSLQVAILKVNDKRGNPIEISAILIFHVEDTAQAQFDVHNFSQFVEIQSESS